MKKLSLLLLFIGNVTLSQTTKTLGSFSKVTGFDQIEIHLVQANTNKVELEGLNSDQVELIIKNDELKLRMPLDKFLKGDKVLATVYYSNLNAIEANEGSFITSNEKINSRIFDIIVKEGGKVEVNTQSSKINIKATSGGIVNIEGKTNNIEANATTGAIIDAIKCESEQATVTSTAGAEISIDANDIIDAKARAGGKVYVYGNPKQVNETTVLGGIVKIMKNN